MANTSVHAFPRPSPVLSISHTPHHRIYRYVGLSGFDQPTPRHCWNSFPTHSIHTFQQGKGLPQPFYMEALSRTHLNGKEHVVEKNMLWYPKEAGNRESPATNTGLSRCNSLPGKGLYCATKWRLAFLQISICSRSVQQFECGKKC